MDDNPNWDYDPGDYFANLRAKAELTPEMMAEAWDAGFEAGANWYPSTPNGTPSDPPQNPYRVGG